MKKNIYFQWLWIFHTPNFLALNFPHSEFSGSQFSGHWIFQPLNFPHSEFSILWIFNPLNFLESEFSNSEFSNSEFSHSEFSKSEFSHSQFSGNRAPHHSHCTRVTITLFVKISKAGDQRKWTFSMMSPL